MNEVKIIVKLGLLFSLFYTTLSVYDEIFARYKIWPMAAATAGTPEKCVKNNFANSTVNILYDTYFFSLSVK